MEYKNTSYKSLKNASMDSLNPCSNGIQKYELGLKVGLGMGSLNPCSNGIQKYRSGKNRRPFKVCLNPCSNGIQKYLNLYNYGKI